MKQGTLLRISIEGPHALCGPADIELFLQRGGAAEAVGEESHGVVVEACRLGVVGEREGEVEARAVGVAVGTRGDGDGHVRGGWGGLGEGTGGQGQEEGG